MSFGQPEVLFHEHAILDTMEAHRNRAAHLVQQMNGNVLLNTPAEDIVADITQQLRFNIPVLHRDQAHADQREAMVEVRDYFSRGYDGVQAVQGTMVELCVPFTGDKDFFFIRPTTSNINPPHAIVQDDQIIITVSGQNLRRKR
jgi:hypothetical protein